MNLVSGTELAWQERMAESFLLSPLYCGSQTTGYRRIGRDAATRGRATDPRAAARLRPRPPAGDGRLDLGRGGQPEHGLPLVARWSPSS